MEFLFKVQMLYPALSMNFCTPVVCTNMLYNISACPFSIIVHINIFKILLMTKLIMLALFRGGWKWYKYYLTVNYIFPVPKQRLSDKEVISNSHSTISCVFL